MKGETQSCEWQIMNCNDNIHRPNGNVHKPNGNEVIEHQTQGHCDQQDSSPQDS